MLVPHSKYSYSSLELEAYTLSEQLHKRDGSDDEWSDIETAKSMLCQLAVKLHYARHIADLALFALAESDKSDDTREMEAKELRLEFNQKVVAD